jgi:hypothetical protein
MPTKVVEYMAHGVPVITTPLPAAADLVRDTDCAAVVPLDDAKPVAEAVLARRDDRARRVELGADGHRVPAERFDWSRLGGVRGGNRADRGSRAFSSMTARSGPRPGTTRSPVEVVLTRQGRPAHPPRRRKVRA